MLEGVPGPAESIQILLAIMVGNLMEVMHRFHKIWPYSFRRFCRTPGLSQKDAIVTMDTKLRQCNKKDPNSKRNI